MADMSDPEIKSSVRKRHWTDWALLTAVIVGMILIVAGVKVYERVYQGEPPYNPPYRAPGTTEADY